MKKHDSKSYKEHLRSTKPEYTLVSKFTNSQSVHTFRHKICGLVFEDIPARIRSLIYICPVCKDKPRNSTYDTKSYKDHLKETDPEYLLVSKEYSTWNHLHNFKHKTCGLVFSVKPCRLRTHKVPCPNCRLIGGTSGVNTHESFTVDLATRWNGEYALVDEYESLTAKQKYLHSVCGVEFNISAGRMRKTKVPCPKCRGIVKGSQYTPEQYQVLLDEQHNGDYILLSAYTQNKDQHKYKHMLCGTEFSATAYHVRKQDVPCPVCCPEGYGIAKRRRIVVGGREFRVQGKENIALPYIWKRLACDINDILYHKRDMPVLKYTFKKEEHRYYPDFFLPSKNVLIEVKDIGSLGLSNRRSRFFGKDVFSRNCEKIRTATDAGFTIHLVLVVGKTVKTLPKGWFKWDKVKLMKWVTANCY